MQRHASRATVSIRRSPLSNKELNNYIGPYRIIRLIGKGAMGEIYLCKDSEENTIAIKWLSTNHPLHVRRFKKEIQGLIQFRHEHIVEVFNFGEALGRPFLTMQYIDGFNGVSFAEKLQISPPSERHERCSSIGKQIAKALHYIHEQGFIHRDVKPSNILIDIHDHATLTDFGTLKNLDFDPDKTKPGTLIGTPFYISPEQLQGKRVTQKTDQFSLGASLYFMLVNNRPFHNYARRDKLIAPSYYDPSIPPRLEACILRLLAESPQDRFQNMQQVVEALSTKRNSGIPLAGRQHVLTEISRCIQRVFQGEQLLVRMIGCQGSGRSWAADTLYNGALRRGVNVFEIVDSRSFVIAQNQLQKKEAILLIDRYGRSSFPDLPLIVIELSPLSLADVRRSIYAIAPKTKNLSKQAERLHRLTGGIPILLIPLLQKYSSDNIFTLPHQVPPLPEVQQYFQSIDWEGIEVLTTLAIATYPLKEAEIDQITQLPAQEILERLRLLGLCRTDYNTWFITNELFAEETLRLAPDSTGIQKRISKITLQFASCDISKSCNEILECSAKGQLATAKLKAIQLSQQTQSFPNRKDHCEALLTLGKVYIDIGLFTKAEIVLADASALAKALQYDQFRYQSHAYRSQISLATNPNSRTGAAVAIDRLIPLLNAPDVLVHATWTWAIAAFGDQVQWEKSFQKVKPILNNTHSIIKIRCFYCLIRSACALGKLQLARELVTLIEQEASQYLLLQWEIQRVKALLTGENPPSTDRLAFNLEPDEIMLLKRRWIQIKGITPDPDWSD
jgi:hypothetical protein